MRVAISEVGVLSAGGSRAVDDLAQGLDQEGVSVTRLCAPAVSPRTRLPSGRQGLGRTALRGFAVLSDRRHRVVEDALKDVGPVDVLISCDGMTFARGVATVMFIQQVLPYCRDGVRTYNLRGRQRLRLMRLLMSRGISRSAGLVVQLPHVPTALGVYGDGELGSKPTVCLEHHFAEGQVLAPVRRRGYLYVGSIRPYKRPEFIRAVANELAAKHGEFLTVAGPDRIEGMGIEYVGPLSGSDLDGAYSRHRALLMTSLCESFGYPIYEALSMGAGVAVPDRDYGCHLRHHDMVTHYQTDSVQEAVASLRYSRPGSRTLPLVSDYSNVAELLLRLAK